MTNYNKRLDEIIQVLAMGEQGVADDFAVGAIDEDTYQVRDDAARDKAKQALTSLIKELVAEAKPEDNCMDCNGVMTTSTPLPEQITCQGCDLIRHVNENGLCDWCSELIPKKKVILHLCADTGSDSYFYQQDSDYEVILIGKDIGVENYYPDRPIYGIIANPVCTEFSTAHSNGKARNPEEGMFLVKECMRIVKQAMYFAELKFYVIENPARGVLHKYLGPPVAKYEPWHYGSPWSKQTALWGDFNMPKPIYDKWDDVPKNDSLYIRPGRRKPSLAFMHKTAYDLIPEFQNLPRPISDMEFRSLCSQNFAKAFKEANL